MEDEFSEIEMAKRGLLKSILDSEVGKVLTWTIEKLNKLLQ